MTQVQRDKFGDAKFAEMYANHRTMDAIAFRKWCIDTIQNHSCSSREKKDGIIRSINATLDKNKLVQMVTNFMLAGEGHKVLRV